MKTLEETMIHELTHAYDFCKSDLDSNNCVQFACSEVIILLFEKKNVGHPLNLLKCFHSNC